MKKYRIAPSKGLEMEQFRFFYIVIFAVFIISGRKFLDAWREELPGALKRRLVFGTLCFACFLVVAFFEIQF